MPIFQTRIKYERQMREPVKAHRVPPYRIITTDMLIEMFDEINVGYNDASNRISYHFKAGLLNRWCGCESLYYYDDNMREFIKANGLKYRW